MVAKKDEKTSLGSKILDYVPWRIALTAAAFAIPVAGPIVGTAVGALAYGNYRQNSKAENPASKSDNEESKKESAKPGRLKKFLFRVCAIAIGFLFGGPIGAAIAGGIVAVDAVSNGKLIQGTEKVLDAGYDALSWAKDKTLDAGKSVVDKVRGSEKGVEEKKDGPTHEFDNPVYSPEVNSTTKAEKRNSSPSSSKLIVGEQTAKLV
ncbi:hypothetical protein [Wolbachia endosymbiont of Oedothorax gibbosus]|uniref:hypothetical protein n=1 Tax=Wolbachia endosymbiont of Oedothorax gibbosus TaxID=931100 RepID=UPI002024C014|nr:hypothetical protein [Wolbachia endosymbiont of Oedothorax gibbosus]